MREKILRAYDNAKQDIDRWFANAARDQIARNRQDDVIECIFCIGKAVMLSLILDRNFGMDTKEEREYMKRIKDYLQFDVLENLEVD